MNRRKLRISGFSALLFAVLGVASQAAPDEATLALGSSARVQIQVPAGQPPLASLEVRGGSEQAASWIADPEQRRRMHDIQFPVRWWQASEVEIDFTPAASGTVELWLSGSWEQDPARPGRPLRIETLWESVSIAGKAAGFSTPAAGAAPSGWQAPWAAYPAADAWPLAGKQGVAATWHDRPLRRVLEVLANQPVRIVLRARAVPPPDQALPARLGKDTPAHQALGRLRRGMNLGNGWEAAPGTWGRLFVPAQVDLIAEQGFDHIRVPVAWHHHLENGKVREAFFEEIEPVLQRAIDRQLGVILNWHHFNALCESPAEHRQTFLDVWKALAARYHAWPPSLILELLNEPHKPLDGETLNALHRDAIAAIRSVSPERILMVNPAGWGSIHELDRLILPDEETRVIVSVHSYDPFHFTHQNAGWADLEGLRGVAFPGPPARPVVLPSALAGREALAEWVRRHNSLPTAQNPSSPAAIRQPLERAAAWSAHFGRPLHLGEFGAYRVADEDSIRRYARCVRELAEGLSIPWCWWEWNAGFGYWDDAQGRPRLRAELLEP